VLRDDSGVDRCFFGGGGGGGDDARCLIYNPPSTPISHRNFSGLPRLVRN
jgi:hypothetical protein